MSDAKLYTTQLQAGLGLVEETRVLLELWSPGMTTSRLYQTALESGRFPAMTARRVRNIVSECFAPRYLVSKGAAAVHLKQLALRVSSTDLMQLMLVFTCRANPILGDFIRTVYWGRYGAGHTLVSTDDARHFVQQSIDDGKTSKRWSEATVRRVSAYLTGCCADYGMLERGSRSKRRIVSFRISPNVVAYFAFEMHFAGVGDAALLAHADWQLFGLAREDVLDELKKLALRGLLMVQAAGDVVRITWMQPNLEALCDVLAEG